MAVEASPMAVEASPIVPFWRHWAPFGYPQGTILVIQGSPGTPSGAPWGPDVDFYRFLVDVGSLWGPSLVLWGPILESF